jgi:hypothetical protein
MLRLRRIPAAAARATLAACALAGLLALLPRPAGAQQVTLDEGKFLVSKDGKPVRVEEFSLDQSGDSLLVRAASHLANQFDDDALPGAQRLTADKSEILVLGVTDFALRSYWSQQIMNAGRDTLRRGIVLGGVDTAFTLYRDINNHGFGDRLAMPPGRIYVLDPPLFTTFNLIGRSLQGKVFDRRPITVLVLGARDTVVETTVSDLGTETIRWAARPVAARKLLIADATTRFTAWISPDGRLLRMEQSEAGILVERRAPPLKRRAPRTK